MRILLTGATGRFGRAFANVSRAPIIVATRARLEDAAALAREVMTTRPAWVVHAAALTDVDGCEADPARATRLNADATGALARACADAGARMVYVSTDYVFDGERGWYREGDATNPLQAYGRSKLAGEGETLAALPEVVIARTSAVFSPFKPDFPRFVADQLAAGRRVQAAHDQRVSPTYAPDLARQVLALVEADAEGIFHAAGATPATRHEMAIAVADALDLDASLIDAVPAASIAWKARRPRDTSLDVAKVSRYAEPMTLDGSLAAWSAAVRLAKEPT